MTDTTATKHVDTAGNVDIKAIKANPRVGARGAQGVDAFALYMEWDVFIKDDGKDKHSAVVRVLIVENTMVWQIKPDTARNAKWNVFKSENEVARDSLINVIAPAYEDDTAYRLGARNNAEPIAIQLVESDVELLNRGEAPMVRYTAKTMFENLFGTLVDA